MGKWIIIAAVLGILCFVCNTARADDPKDILIIVNKSVSQENITLAEIRNLFLKERTSWRGGSKAVPIHAPAGSSLRKAFVNRVLGMDSEDEKIFWRERKIRTGKVGPAEFSNVLKAVFKLRNSISYIYRSDYVEGVVKVVLVLPAQGGA